MNALVGVQIEVEVESVKFHAAPQEFARDVIETQEPID